MSELEYVPLRKVSDRIDRGWKLATDLKVGDYAALMRAPEPQHPRSNQSRAASSRNLENQDNRWRELRNDEKGSRKVLALVGAREA